MWICPAPNAGRTSLNYPFSPLATVRCTAPSAIALSARKDAAAAEAAAVSAAARARCIRLI